ncbi:MAG: hypothetical protein HS115_13935 [Spirochaetales bacterium]|nr:hypothetical protein [Spirochaetales bacterium]
MKTEALKQEIRKRWDDPLWSSAMAGAVYQKAQRQKFLRMSARAASILLAGSFLLWVLWTGPAAESSDDEANESAALLEIEEAAEILPAMDLAFDEFPEMELSLLPW